MKKRMDKGYQASETAKREAYKCMKCMQPFPNTSSKSTLGQHVDSKHSKFKFNECFPTFNTDDAGSSNDHKNKKNNKYNKKGKKGKNRK